MTVECGTLPKIDLTQSQKRIVPALRREMVEIADDIKAEIEKLRHKQKECHEQ